MKICKCGETDLSKFSVSRKRKDGLQSICKKCSSTWYQENSKKVKTQTYGSNKKRIAANRELVWDHLSSNPCVDCGESDPIVLEFDHVRGVKIGNISEMTRDSGTETLLEEIAKCDVRCANCHRRKTAKDRKHWIDKRVCSSVAEQTALNRPDWVRLPTHPPRKPRFPQDSGKRYFGFV